MLKCIWFTRDEICCHKLPRTLTFTVNSDISNFSEAAGILNLKAYITYYLEDWFQTYDFFKDFCPLFNSCVSWLGTKRKRISLWNTGFGWDRWKRKLERIKKFFYIKYITLIFQIGIYSQQGWWTLNKDRGDEWTLNEIILFSISS